MSASLQHQIKYGRNTKRQKYDCIRLQLSVKLLSYFFVRKESIATTFTQKYACEENDQKVFLDFVFERKIINR